MHASAMTPACFHQFVGVVAVLAANDDDNIRFLRQFDGRILPLLRWLANGVNEPNFGIWKTPAN